MTATDTDTLEALDFAYEPPCESQHRVSECSVTVMWSAPPFPCGCIPRRLVCQANYDYMRAMNPAGICSQCNHIAPKADWLAGWLPVNR